MRTAAALILAAASAAVAQTVTGNFNSSSKRGLVFTPNTKHQQDNQIWVTNSDLTWYYNYGSTPSPAYNNRTQDNFEFIPMLWSTGNTFYSDVKNLIDSGRKITHVLAYNEPDGSSSQGGSNIDPTVAAQNWISQIQPLKALGVKLGAPAVTGAPAGFTWLESFFDACANLGTNCTADFFPVHWYGTFESLASHCGQVYATYSLPVWVTEYTYSNESLSDTQTFFEETASFMDRTPWLQRYSYFGAFRSSVSNVGPNAAMLTEKGLLTDIGSWYLGGASTGNIPHDSPDTSSSASILVSGKAWMAAVAGLAGLLVLA